MRITGYNQNINKMYSKNQEPKKVINKIKREPTKEQLLSIQESQKREAEWLKEGGAIVPIDWDAVKEMINLTPEELKLRGEQDREEIKQKFDEEIGEINKEYKDAIENIEKNSEKNEKRTRAQDEDKARKIIKSISRGMTVPPEDLLFAQELFPEEVTSAIKKGKEYFFNLIRNIDVRI